ncbi:LysR family transcriptional regulator [Edaphobacter flagellatus]|jgi:DNA-binding transcriptional LysR family regulator|uniref:LysR family transcriptional regulator n=1 Tax=Edaphobacter flagellatus TaxID=1933044 RepID=UPI0021B43DBD|nr:LysR family transcriptional regulator [Edaphobacter flagellatus]
MSDDVTIYDLKCVIAVAQEGSESRAATRLHTTQPGVSRTIHDVETAVGVRLFYTWHGGSRLTDAGKAFVEEILHSIDQYERAVHRAQNVANRQAGLLQIAYSSFLCPELLTIVSDLHFERPNDPVLRMTSLHTVGIIRGVLEGQYQAGIGYLPINYSELETRELLDEDLMMCIPARHRLFRLDSISPQDLDREPLIGVSELALPEFHKEIDAYFEVLGIELNVIAQPFTFHEAIHMAAADRGIAMVSSGWSHLTKDGIAFRPLADKLLTMKSGVIVRRDSRTDAINDFQNLLWMKTEQLRKERQKTTLNPRHRST